MGISVSGSRADRTAISEEVRADWGVISHSSSWKALSTLVSALVKATCLCIKFSSSSVSCASSGHRLCNAVEVKAFWRAMRLSASESGSTAKSTSLNKMNSFSVRPELSSSCSSNICCVNAGDAMAFNATDRPIELSSSSHSTSSESSSKVECPVHELVPINLGLQELRALEIVTILSLRALGAIVEAVSSSKLNPVEATPWDFVTTFKRSTDSGKSTDGWAIRDVCAIARNKPQARKQRSFLGALQISVVFD
mmetsp:Transcript_31159/g.72601  ORF Transcript_31159/g.72601 Transcript_31159/m.72601 type:complete len:253 (+) Transcript_31159:2052-2810(+)